MDDETKVCFVSWFVVGTSQIFVGMFLQIYSAAHFQMSGYIRYWHLRRFMLLYPNTTNIAKITRTTGPTPAPIAIFK